MFNLINKFVNEIVGSLRTLNQRFFYNETIGN